MRSFFVRNLSYLLVILGASTVTATEFDAHRLVQLGPNIRYNLSGNAPIHWGSWVPQGHVLVDFNWFEPLDASRYGSLVVDTTRYLSLHGGVELSPFYAQLTTSIGVAPFQANPQVEARIVYSNLLFFRSNVEMAMGDRTPGKLVNKTWQADYIFEQLYKESSADQLQSFGFWIDFSLNVGFLRIWNSVGYTYLDINSNYDGKSFDYSRGVPVYSRDDVFVGETHWALSGGQNWGWFFDFTYCATGYLGEVSGRYSKESLTLITFYSGPSWHWNEGRSRFSIVPGFWSRFGETSIDGPWLERFIIQVNYQSVWQLPFAK